MGLLSTIGAASARAFGLTRIGLIRDLYFNLVTLLLPGNGTNGAQNNTFLDSGTANGGSGFTITRNGDVTQGTFSPFSQTGWSNYFDGSGDRLSSSGSVNSAAGTSNFCVEFFVYYTRYPGQFTTIFSTKPDFNGTATGYGIGVENDGTIYNYSNAYIAESASGVFSLNTWHHMVFTRSGTTARLFLNGVLRATGTNSQDFSNQAFAIGSHNGTTNSEPMDGYVSNVRFVKGSIPTTYQTSSTTVGDTIFTIPTAPLSTSSQGATSADVEILTCQSNRFVDNSTNEFAITHNGDVRVIPFSPFAPTAAYSAATVGGSGYFDGTGDNLSYTTTALGSGDFTIEGWVYLLANNAFAGFWSTFNSATGTGCWLGIKNTGVLTFEIGNGTAASLSISSTSALPINTWAYVAARRNGTSVNIYVNGSSVASGTSSANISNTSAVVARLYSNLSQEFMTGYISNLRISNNARTISVPTAPYTNDANTLTLFNFTNAGITDATAKNVLETEGGAQISTAQSKFGGSSMYFDGTGDYLTFPASQNWVFGTGDFTIEFWVYANSLSSTAIFIECRNNTVGPVIFYDSGALRVNFNSVGGVLITGGALLTATWYHIALARFGSSTRLFVNGTQSGSTATDTNNYSNNTLIVGASYLATQTLNGYIDDLRITKGYARYVEGTGANAGKMVFNGTNNLALPSSAFPLQ